MLSSRVQANATSSQVTELTEDLLAESELFGCAKAGVLRGGAALQLFEAHRHAASAVVHSEPCAI